MAGEIQGPNTKKFNRTLPFPIQLRQKSGCASVAVTRPSTRGLTGEFESQILNQRLVHSLVLQLRTLDTFQAGITNQMGPPSRHTFTTL